jgi:hypothetical protein
MNTVITYELVGYGASVLVALSLMMSSILKLRIINLSGAVTFMVYGLLIGSMPVATVNAFIIGVNGYYLFTIFNAREYFRIMEMEPSSEYLRYFLEFYRKDIRTFNPDFAFVPDADRKVYFILRNLVPAGLLIFEPRGDGEGAVALDFVIPGYRDFKTGTFLYRDNKQIFSRHGIDRIIARPGSRRHERYLRRMGFEKIQRGGEPLYRRSIPE